MRLAIIPARGGSKRIPRKNILPFAGQPMIAYAIKVAQVSGLFDHVVVTTDDAEIAAVARQFGAETPFMRAPELSDDHAGTVPVIADAIRRCAEHGWAATQVCCIYPGVPLLQADDLQAGLKLLDSSGADYAFGVAEFPAAIQRALRMAPDGAMSPFFDQYVLTRTQDLEAGYYDAGQFYWGTSDAWIKGESPHRQGRGWVLPAWRAVDIDTPDDWERAETAFEARQARVARAAGATK